MPYTVVYKKSLDPIISMPSPPSSEHRKHRTPWIWMMDHLPGPLYHSSDHYKKKNDPDNDNDPMLDIRKDIVEFRDLCRSLEDVKSMDRDFFWTVVATIEYYRRLLDDSLALIDVELGSASVVKEVNTTNLELAKMDQQRQEAERYNRIYTAIRHLSPNLEFSSPRLFIVLPAALDHNHLSPSSSINSIHHLLSGYVGTPPPRPKFRLYFLCDYDYGELPTNSYGFPRNSSSAHKRIHPRHVHLSNHPGYVIHRPHEFFQLYGHYILTMLEMVKYGFSDGDAQIPPLDSGKLVHCCHGTAPHHRLTHETIGPLVDQAITLLQELTTAKLETKTWLDAWETRQIHSFLDLQDERNGTGGLCRSVLSAFNVRWLCQDHTFQDYDIDMFRHYIEVQGGMVDIQQSIISIRLWTFEMAVDFCKVLWETRRVFEVTASLMWSPLTRDSLEDLVMEFARSGVHVLHIDGVTTHVHPQSSLEESSDMFFQLVKANGLQLLTLLNYPRISEQYIYLGKSDVNAYGLVLNATYGRPYLDWLELRLGLDRYLEGIQATRLGHDIRSCLEGLTGVLTRLNAYDIKEIDVFDGRTNSWQGRFGVAGCVVYGLSEIVFPNNIFTPFALSCGTLRRLILRSQCADDIWNHLQLVDSQPLLQQVEILIQQTEQFNKAITDLYRQWSHGFHLQVMLCEKGMDDIKNNATFVTWNEQMLQKSVVCLWWSEDHISGRAWNMTLLDAALRQFSRTLISFTLDISSCMTERALLRTQSVLQRVRLEHLHIRCVDFPRHLRNPIASVLRTVQWPTIKSLSLSGDDIDDWIRLWTRKGNLFHQNSALTVESQLLQVEIVGTSSADLHPLSHASVLSIHRLLYDASELQDFSLENVELQEESDWDLILDVIEELPLKSLSFKGSNFPENRRMPSLLLMKAVNKEIG
ncbi:hypothetical protein BGZ94_001823 [Podila epigama]|nr:hypothetical protein BGZ94_001823 [Podila epigama]